MINDLRNSHNWRSMTKAQRGCFVDLLCAAWTESDPRFPCSLTANRDVLYRITECFTEQDRADTEAVLKMVYHEEEGRLYNPRQLEIWGQQSKKNERCREAAEERWKRARAKRDAKQIPEPCERISERMCETDMDAYANACAATSDSDSVLCTLNSSSVFDPKDTVSIPKIEPYKLPEHFDPDRQCITGGRFALREYPFIYLTPREYERARKEWERQGLDADDWEAGLAKANVDLEAASLNRNIEAKGYKYLAGHTLTETLKQVSERTRGEKQKQGTNGKGAPQQFTTAAERIKEHNRKSFEEIEQLLKGEMIDVTE